MDRLHSCLWTPTTNRCSFLKVKWLDILMLYFVNILELHRGKYKKKSDWGWYCQKYIHNWEGMWSDLCTMIWWNLLNMMWMKANVMFHKSMKLIVTIKHCILTRWWLIYQWNWLYHCLCQKLIIHLFTLLGIQVINLPTQPANQQVPVVSTNNEFFLLFFIKRICWMISGNIISVLLLTCEVLVHTSAIFPCRITILERSHCMWMQNSTTGFSNGGKPGPN